VDDGAEALFEVEGGRDGFVGLEERRQLPLTAFKRFVPLPDCRQFEEELSLRG